MATVTFRIWRGSRGQGDFQDFLVGMGRLIFEAINERQIVAVQSLVALLAAGYVIVNFLVDILYAVLDPRIRRG